MNGANITCFMRQTPEWWLVWSLFCFPLRLLAGSSGFSLNDGSDLKLLTKLVHAWRFVFGRARRGFRLLQCFSVGFAVNFHIFDSFQY